MKRSLSKSLDISSTKRKLLQFVSFDKCNVKKNAGNVFSFGYNRSTKCTGKSQDETQFARIWKIQILLDNSKSYANHAPISDVVICLPHSSQPTYAWCKNCLFSLPDAHAQKTVEDTERKAEEEEEGGNSDAESEAAKSETSEDEVKIKRSSAAKLLSIPLSSELGHRVRKHIEAKMDLWKRPQQQQQQQQQPSEEPKHDLDTSTTTDPAVDHDKFCQDDDQEKSEQQLSRLRNRNMSEYPVTFSKRRFVSDWKAHKYKFSTRDKIEFWRTVKTGLNTRARRLQSKMKKCSVRLTKLTRRQKNMWLLGYQQPKVLLRALTQRQIDQWSRPVSRSSNKGLIPMMLDIPHSPSEELYKDLKLADLRVPLNRANITPTQSVSYSADELKTGAGIKQKYKTVLKVLDTPHNPREQTNKNAEDLRASVNRANVSPSVSPTQQKYKTVLKVLELKPSIAPARPAWFPSPSSADTDADAPSRKQPKTESANIGKKRKRHLSEPMASQHVRVDGGYVTVEPIRKLEPKRLKCDGGFLTVEPIVKLEPMVFHGGGGKSTPAKKRAGKDDVSRVKKWNASGGVLVPLVEDVRSSTTYSDDPNADDLLVTVDSAESSFSDAVLSSEGGDVIKQNSASMTPAVLYISSTPAGGDASVNGTAETLNSTTSGVNKTPGAPSLNFPRRTKRKYKPKQRSECPDFIAGPKLQKVKTAKKNPATSVKKKPAQAHQHRGVTKKKIKGGKVTKPGWRKPKTAAATKAWKPATTKVGKKTTTAATTTNQRSVSQHPGNSHRQNRKKSAPKRRWNRTSSIPKKKRQNPNLKMKQKQRKSSSATSSEGKKPALMFHCHLCGTELKAEMSGERDFIAEHYQERHNLYNIHLRENITPEGQRTVSIISVVDAHAQPVKVKKVVKKTKPKKKRKKKVVMKKKLKEEEEKEPETEVGIENDAKSAQPEVEAEDADAHVPDDAPPPKPQTQDVTTDASAVPVSETTADDSQ